MAKTVVKSMIAVYHRLVYDYGMKTLDEIPEQYRQPVEEYHKQLTMPEERLEEETKDLS